MIETSVIIVNYNTRQMTLDCISSVMKHADMSKTEILLVDNDSSDGSVEALRTSFKNIRIYQSATNLGFAKANNLAAKDAKGKYILLLNSDTLLLDDAIGKIRDFAEAHPGYGIYGVKTLYEDHSHNTGSCWGFPTPRSLLSSALGLNQAFKKSRFLNAESYDWQDWTSPFEADAVSGCFLLMRKELWDKLGGFDENFFMYGEDIDLALRAKAMNLGCIVEPRIEIVHLRGKSEKVKSEKWVRLFKAKAQLFRKHESEGKASRMTSLLTLYAWIRMFGLYWLRLVKPSTAASWQTWREIYRNRLKWHEKKILAIASGGGHWIQLLRIRPAFEGSSVVFATTIDGYRHSVEGHRFYRIIDANQNTKVKLLLMALQVALIAVKERPNVVVSTGAAPGFFALLAGKALGSRTIWLDSIANTEELSLSGQRVKKIADLYLTQWENLASTEGPSYYGAVL